MPGDAPVAPQMQLPDLNEATLNEPSGLNSVLANGFGTVWYCGMTKNIANVSNGPLDWNCSGATAGVVSADINKGAGTVLRSYNDWTNISFTGGTIGAGVIAEVPLLTTPIEEMTLQESQAEPPPPPSSLAIRFANGVARLAWNPLGQAGEYTYRIYRRTGVGSFVQVGTVGATTFSEGLATGTYEYRVTGVNGIGRESGPSNTVTLVVP